MAKIIRVLIIYHKNIVLVVFIFIYRTYLKIFLINIYYLILDQL